MAELSSAKRRLTGNSGKAIPPPIKNVAWPSLNLPETFRSGSLSENRGQRSLLNTFPFNQQELDDPRDQAAGKVVDIVQEEAVEKVSEDEARSQEGLQVSTSSVDLETRDSRQGEDDLEVGFAAVAAAAPGEDGKRCIDKVQMVEETIYDEVVQ